MSHLRITVYVEGVKRLVGTDQIERELFTVDPLTMPQSGSHGQSGRLRVFQEHRVETVSRIEFVLPEEQMKFVEMVESFASEHGFVLEVIDMGKKNILERWIKKKINGIRIYPTLVTEAGHRIEGNITREQLESRLPTA